MKLAVFGASGRMGLTLIRAITDSGSIELSGALDAPNSPKLNQDSGVLAGIRENGVGITADVEAV